MSDIADQFKGLPMGDLIGGPLQAACDAQVNLAKATASFIQSVGFQTIKKDDGSDDPYGAVRTAKFQFDRPTGGALPPPDGTAVPTERVSLEVPLLAIVKVPNLSIDNVDITFDMEVKSSVSDKSSTSASASIGVEAGGGWGPFSAKVSINGSVSSSKERSRTTDSSAKYHVSVRATDTGMPEGMARVLDMMNAAIAPRAIEETPALPAPN